MSQPVCSHCGGLHYGSPVGECVYICKECHCDIRPDAIPRCACPPKPQPLGFFERQREIQEALAAEAKNYRLVGKNSGVGMIVDERLRQIRVENWTPEHDDEHVNGELTEMARAYTWAALCMVSFGADMEDVSKYVPNDFPKGWDKQWWKPSPDPIRNLVKAGALIAAEIDRLHRKAETDRLALEAHNKQVALDELLKQPTSDPEKFVRCKWCGQEMPKPHPSITTPVCLSCIPF